MQIVRWDAEKYAPVETCVYARPGEAHTGPYSDEHIIPYGLQPKGGDWFLPKASCKACADITKKFEDHYQRATTGLLREQLDLKTRRKKNRGKPVDVVFATGDGTHRRYADLAINLPKYCIGMQLQLPGILRGAPPWETVFEGAQFIVRHASGEMEGYLEGASSKGRLLLGQIRPINHARMLAKIAHVYAYAKLGPDTFEPYLLDIIIRGAETAPYLIGGLPGRVVSDSNLLHDVFPTSVRTAHSPVVYLGIVVHLFANFGMPAYIAIVGKQLKEIGLPPLDGPALQLFGQG